MVSPRKIDRFGLDSFSSADFHSAPAAGGAASPDSDSDSDSEDGDEIALGRERSGTGPFELSALQRGSTAPLRISY